MHETTAHTAVAASSAGTAPASSFNSASEPPPAAPDARLAKKQRGQSFSAFPVSLESAVPSWASTSASSTSASSPSSTNLVAAGGAASDVLHTADDEMAKLADAAAADSSSSCSSSSADDEDADQASYSKSVSPTGCPTEELTDEGDELTLEATEAAGELEEGEAYSQEPVASVTDEDASADEEEGKDEQIAAESAAPASQLSSSSGESSALSDGWPPMLSMADVLRREPKEWCARLGIKQSSKRYKFAKAQMESNLCKETFWARLADEPKPNKYFKKAFSKLKPSQLEQLRSLTGQKTAT